MNTRIRGYEVRGHRTEYNLLTVRCMNIGHRRPFILRYADAERCSDCKEGKRKRRVCCFSCIHLDSG